MICLQNNDTFYELEKIQFRNTFTPSTFLDTSYIYINIRMRFVKVDAINVRDLMFIWFFNQTVLQLCFGFQLINQTLTCSRPHKSFTDSFVSFKRRAIYVPSLPLYWIRVFLSRRGLHYYLRCSTRQNWAFVERSNWPDIKCEYRTPLENLNSNTLLEIRPRFYTF